MTRMTLRFLATVLLLVSSTGAAFADLGKLNARARIALQELRNGQSADALKSKGTAINAEGELDVFIVGSVSRAQLEAAGARVRTEVPGGFFTAYIPVSAAEQVAALAGVTRIEGAAPAELELDASVPSTGANVLRGAGPAFTGLNGAGVLVGDVDTGIDYGHDDFKDAGGLTRLVNIWDQTVATGPNPAGYAYGTEWTQAQINANVSTEVDVAGHGTHVMGIAGGDGSGTGGAVPAFTYVGMAPKADLLMVKTTLQTTDILDGVAYVFGRATALGENAVCNLSLGSHYGPHDGSSAFESALSALTGPGRIIIKSAGNERGVAQHDERFATLAGTNATMAIAGSAVNRTIAIAGYYNATETIDVTITTPNATVIGPISLGGINAAYPGVATLNGQVYLENGATVYPSGAREIYVEITPAAGQNMNGTWTFTFTATALGAANGEVDCWRFFQSTGSTGNFVLGNQNNEELISEPGNAVDLITTAAWATKRTWNDCNGFLLNFSGSVAVGNLAAFSSPGPTRDGRQKPDIAAPGAVIGSATSFDIIQSCAAGGSTNLPDGLMHTINQGTSMAAPHVTGATALILQKYGAVTPAFVKTFLNARAKTDGFTGAVWNKDFGNGKLFLGDMIDPVVTVVAPNGGELFQIGTNVNLSWNATDALGGVTAVDIYLSRTGVGGPYETIALAQPNTGSYLWFASGLATPNAILKVVASDAALNTGTDVSDAEWTLEAPVPVVLPMFEAESAGGAITLRWQFADPNVTLSRVERSDVANGSYSPIAVELSNLDGVDQAIDRTAEAGATYYYRLIARRIGGEEVVFGPISAKLTAVVTAFALSRPAPNPVSAGPVRVEFAVARESQVKITVLDVRGREVATVAEGRYTPGVYSVNWNRQANGGRAAAGLYFIHYRTPAGNYTQRLVVAN
jgi:subtilisin family serine protease